MVVQKKRNIERAERATESLRDYLWEDEWEMAIADLLCDLRHLCDKHDVSFAEADKTAQMHYAAEVFGDEFEPEDGEDA